MHKAFRPAYNHTKIMKRKSIFKEIILTIDTRYFKSIHNF